MTETDRHNALVEELKEVIVKRTQERDAWRTLARVRAQHLEAIAQEIRAAAVVDVVDEVDAARKKK